MALVESVPHVVPWPVAWGAGEVAAAGVEVGEGAAVGHDDVEEVVSELLQFEQGAGRNSEIIKLINAKIIFSISAHQSENDPPLWAATIDIAKRSTTIVKTFISVLRSRQKLLLKFQTNVMLLEAFVWIK